MDKLTTAATVVEREDTPGGQVVEGDSVADSLEGADYAIGLGE